MAESTRPRPVSFRNDVVPLLTKLGCNQGACHGAQRGKGGFKLSLLGFEPESDYVAIVKSAEERRVTPFAPEESLLLLKPTLAVAHRGGKRLEDDSPAYRLLTLWLAEGAPGPRDDDPRVVALKVTPEACVMEPGQERQLSVVATLSGGLKRVVTADTRFDSLSEGVATVRPSGLAKTAGKGVANIMVRYQGHSAIARLTVPFASPRPFEFSSPNIIDKNAAAKWRELGLVPSPACSDAEFLRRAMLDTIGTTPTPDEIEDFLADNDPGKRTKLVDRLLDRPEYVDYWTLKWGDILRVNSDKLGAQGMLAFNFGCGLRFGPTCRSIAWLRSSSPRRDPFSAMGRPITSRSPAILPTLPRRPHRYSWACGCNVPGVITTRSRHTARTIIMAWRRTSRGSGPNGATSSGFSAATRSFTSPKRERSTNRVPARRWHPGHSRTSPATMRAIAAGHWPNG